MVTTAAIVTGWGLAIIGWVAAYSLAQPKRSDCTDCDIWKRAANERMRVLINTQGELGRAREDLAASQKDNAVAASELARQDVLIGELKADLDSKAKQLTAALDKLDRIAAEFAVPTRGS